MPYTVEQSVHAGRLHVQYLKTGMFLPVFLIIMDTPSRIRKSIHMLKLEVFMCLWLLYFESNAKSEAELALRTR